MSLVEKWVLMGTHSPKASDFMLFVLFIVFELFYNPVEIEVNL